MDPLFLEMRRVLVDDPQVKETVFHGLVSYRRRADNAWITWLTHTKTQARLALPDDHDCPEQLAVKSKDGWTTLGMTSRDELDVAVQLLRERIERVHRDGGELRPHRRVTGASGSRCRSVSTPHNCGVAGSGRLAPPSGPPLGLSRPLQGRARAKLSGSATPDTLYAIMPYDG